MENNSVFKVIDYGRVVFNILPIMKEKNMSVTQVVKRTGLHHLVVNRYCSGNAVRYDGETLAKLCFVLDCNISDIMNYEKPIKKD